MLLTETDGSWSAGIEPTLPANASVNGDADVESVSCPSAGNCSAVGGYTDGSGVEQGLLLTETAGSWATGTEAVLPADSTNLGAELTSVSCASAGSCTAVGSYDYSLVIVGRDQEEARAKGLLLTETAGSWATGVEATLPANAVGPDAVNGTYPLTVSCSSAGNCSAAGSYYYDSFGLHGLLLTQTAGSWAPGVEAMPDYGAPSPGFLNAVSCASAGNCGALVMGENLLTETSGSWASGVEPSLPANAVPGRFLLYTVSCGSAGNCSAVGSYWDESSDEFGLLIGGSPALVKLDISPNGTGSGTVSSVPTGIACGSTCSASFVAGTSLTLTATPTPGSRFSGWSGGGCSGTESCQPNMDISEQNVTASFSLVPKCVVPRLKGETLKAAKHAIRTHNCTVGKITHTTSRTIKKGHVISQKPRPGRRLQHGAKVRLQVSTGKR